MNEQIDWAQISTIVTAIATVAYVLLTLAIVRETVVLRKAQTEPNIVLLIQPEEKYPNFYDIIVKNTGTGAAYNLKWNYDETSELASKQDIGINRFEFFQGAKYFGPGQEFHSFFGSGTELLGKPFIPALELNLEYENENGKKSSKKFYLDPALLYGHSWIGNRPDMADSLQAIQRELRDLAIGFKRIKVDVYDKSDREKEQRIRKKTHNLAPDKNMGRKIKQKK